MVFDFFRGSSGPQGIDAVEAQIVQMVRDSRTVFETSMSAVFGGGKSTEAKQEVSQTDQGINEAQQDVRRTLMMHASVQGDVDLPLVLTYMSVVKDAERIGDYAKNLYDLAKFGVDFEVARTGPNWRGTATTSIGCSRMPPMPSSSRIPNEPSS